MNTIPSEIITHIGSYLPFQSLTNAKQVNKEWYSSLEPLHEDSYNKIQWVIGVYYVNSGNESTIYASFIAIGCPSNADRLCHKYTPIAAPLDLQLMFLRGRGGKLLKKKSLHFDINMIHSIITLVLDKKKRSSFSRRFHVDLHRVIGDLDNIQEFDIPVSKDWFAEPIHHGAMIYSYCPVEDTESFMDEDIYSDDSYESDEMDEW